MSEAVAPRRQNRRRRGVLVVAVVTLPASLLAVLALEMALARRGPTLGGPVLGLDRRVGEEPGPGLEVVWLGDSTAAGVGASTAASALPTLVAAGLSRPVQLTVLARSGATVNEVIDLQLPVVAGTEPDMVFVSVGANDVTHLTSRSDFGRRYRRLVAHLPEPVESVLLGVPDMGAIPRLAQPLRALAGFRGRQLDEVVREVAADTASVYVDIAGETGPPLRADPGRYFAADRFHPSDAGYGLWVDAVLAALRRSAMLEG